MNTKINQIQHRLAIGNEQERLAALTELLECGQQGFDCLIEHSLRDKSENVKQSVYWILHNYNPYLTASPEERIKICPTDTITCLTISLDNKILVGGSWQKIWVWYLQTGEIFHSLIGHSHWVLSLAISPDRNSLISGSADKTIKIWNLKNGQLINTLNGHSSWVNAVSVSKDGKTIISGSSDKTIRIWNLTTGKLNKTIQEEKELESVLSLSISPDNKVIACGCTNKKVILFDLDNGKLIRTLEGHNDWIKEVIITSDNQKIISACRNGEIKFWEANLESKNNFPDSNKLGSSLKIGLLDTVATGLCFVGLWYISILTAILGRAFLNNDSSTQLPALSLECVKTNKYGQTVNSMNYCQTKNILVIGNKTSIKVHSLNQNIISTFLEESDFISSIAITHDAEIIVSAGNDWLKLWNRTTEKTLHCLKGCSYPKLSQIIIIESSQELFSGQSKLFTVKGLDQNKIEINLDNEKIKWEATGGNIKQGWFTAGQREGKFEIKAKLSIFKASLSINIMEPPRITQLIVTPAALKLEFGQSHKITGKVLDQRDNTMPEELISWTKVSGGEIDTSGNFKAGYIAGTFELIASASGIQKIIPINIFEPPKLSQLVLISSTSYLYFQETFQFTLKGIDQYGNNIKTGKINWNASEEIIDDQGIYYAGNKEGRVLIEASIGDISTFIKVDIREPSKLKELKILPSFISLLPGENNSFSVKAYDQYNEEIPVSNIKWEATNGVIDQYGNFDTNYNQKGYCQIIAKVSNLTVTAEVNILTVLRYIEISPKEVELEPEQEYQFTLIGFDQIDETLNPKNALWKATKGGSINNNGVFKGDYNNREVTITASIANIIATAKVILLPVLRRLEITPGFVYLKPTEKQSFIVKGVDQFGNEIDPGQIYWQTTAGKIDQNGNLTVAHHDQGYIQVTATSPIGSKYVYSEQRFFLYTGISTLMMSWFISYEILLNEIFSVDSKPTASELDLNDFSKIEKDTDSLNQSEEIEVANIETDVITKTDTFIDINLLDFNSALQEWILKKLSKLVTRFIVSVSRFLLNEASAKLTISADVFVLQIEQNPYKYFECLQILYNHSSWVSSLAITPDGQKLISGSWDDTIQIYNLNTHDLIHTLISHKHDVECVAITPDGQKVISAGWDGNIKIWSCSEGNLIDSLYCSDQVVFVGITSDGQNLISGESSHNIKIWDLKNQELVNTLNFYLPHENHPFYWHKCIIINPNDQDIIVATNIIKFYRLQTGKLHIIVGGNLGWVYALAITQDGRKLISSYDKKIIIWDLTTKSQDIMLVLNSYAEKNIALVITPDGQRLVSSGFGINKQPEPEGIIDYKSFIEIWDLNTGERLHSIHEDTTEYNFIYCLAITPDGRKIISGYKDGRIKIWGVPIFHEKP